MIVSLHLLQKENQPLSLTSKHNTLIQHTRLTWRFDAELESHLQYYPVENRALLFSEVFFRYPNTTDSSTLSYFLIDSLSSPPLLSCSCPP